MDVGFESKPGASVRVEVRLSRETCSRPLPKRRDWESLETV